jgi:hypothetical protein
MQTYPHLVVVDERLEGPQQLLLLQRRVRQQARPAVQVLRSQPPHQRCLVLAQAQVHREQVVLDLRGEAPEPQVQERRRRCTRREPDEVETVR